MKSTKDYTIFRNITGNRTINIGHSERLAEAIERKNLLKYFPVLVNENMEVIDGQHRLMAAAKLGYEIYYETIPGLVLEDVMSINTHNKNWSLADFVDAYIRLGYEDYQVLKDFAKQYHLSLGISASLLSGFRSMRGGNKITQAVKNGSFHIGSLPLARVIAQQVNELQEFAEFDTTIDREFLAALILLHGNENFDYDRLVAKLRLGKHKLTKRPSDKYYLIQIEDLYNYNTSVNKVELYASSQVG